MLNYYVQLYLSETKSEIKLAEDSRKEIGIVEVAKKIGIEMHRLYCWERLGIVNPVMKPFGTRQFRRYSREDIEKAIFVKLLVDEEGYTLKAAVRKLGEKE